MEAGQSWQQPGLVTAAGLGAPSEELRGKAVLTPGAAASPAAQGVDHTVWTDLGISLSSSLPTPTSQ